LQALLLIAKNYLQPGKLFASICHALLGKLILPKIIAKQCSISKRPLAASLISIMFIHPCCHMIGISKRIALTKQLLLSHQLLIDINKIFMSHVQIITAYILSNIAAILFFVATIYSNRLARILFAALFIGAGFVNWIVVHTNSKGYLDYSKYAVGLYRDIIVGPFQNHITAIVSFIAICQLLIGAGLLYKGRILRTACVAGSIFLVAISPLGIASAFPSGLIWAVGLFVLYKDRFEKNIFKMKWST
jgi:hypothetical protein